MYQYSLNETSQKINNKFSLLPKRKYLRNNSSKAAVFLWNHLKNSQQGRKFRRQHSVGHFILDFYCATERLGIEIDGDLHFEKSAVEYDIHRTKLLENFRIKIIRFTNQDVYKKMDYVLGEIRKNFTTPSSAQDNADATPPPRGGDSQDRADDI